MINQLTESSEQRNKQIQHLETVIAGQANNSTPEDDLYNMVAKYAKTLSKETQEWMQEEIWSIWRQAKRRESQIANPPSVPRAYMCSANNATESTQSISANA